MPLTDLTEAALRAALKEYEDLFSRLDVDGIAADFADDVQVQYSNYEPFQGKEQLRAFLAQRFAGVKDYRLSKRLELVQSPSFAASWTAEWIDRGTGVSMRGFGVEILTVQSGLFVEWRASLSAWPAGKAIGIRSSSK